MTVEQLWQPVPGGSGTYITELLAALDRRQDTQVRGLAAAHRPRSGRGPRGVTVDHAPLPRRVLYDAWNGLRAPRAEALLRRPVDVVHATTWAVPPTTRPLVVTVHDLAFLHDPGHFTARGARFFVRSLERVVDEASAVIVPSRVVAEDCVAHGIEESRLHVVPHGVRVPAVTARQVDDLRRRHGLHRPYVLWAGTLEPRKNVERLVAAFELVRGERPGMELVLVGPSGWGGRTTSDAPGVRALGRLSWHDLHTAYAGAEAFCFPSIREGFGLPVLEAMAHGVPVVTSAGTSMAEVVGDPDNGVLVDPADASSVAAGILDALDRRSPLAERSLRRAADFTWDRSAAATRAVYGLAQEA
ncbi:glycosyl transferase family 1 [Actinotalea ferrariae CF5-4]|uniref:Glycosyl transferase family 1 n=1 Tax=Actinotalea ferrariae CF5-4 TaxID=948458 RepID=A0A021VUE9_9CELL|nr:glycosyl transferase family 1 [Actinotalea ferrariae CF5-4]